MDSLPKTPKEYRLWWEENTSVPYGYCWCGCGTKTPREVVRHPKRQKFKGEPRLYFPQHNHTTARKQRSVDYVEETRGYLTLCWIWQGTLNKGYGMDTLDKTKEVEAHRQYYVRRYGPIPDKLVIHHLCYQRSCVNPAHLLAMDSIKHLRLHAGQKKRPLLRE